MKYVALIQKRGEFGNRHFVISCEESKEEFCKRIRKGYIEPHDIPYWEVEIYELGQPIDFY